MDFWWFSAFCPLRNGFIYHFLSMGLENDVFYFLKSRDSIYSRMAIYIYIYAHVCVCMYIYICIYACAFIHSFMCSRRSA